MCRGGNQQGIGRVEMIGQQVGFEVHSHHMIPTYLVVIRPLQYSMIQSATLFAKKGNKARVTSSTYLYVQFMHDKSELIIFVYITCWSKYSS